MKEITAGASAIMAAALVLGACAKHDDAGNATVTNETIVNETVESGPVTDNLASPDVTGNAADLNASASGNGF